MALDKTDFANQKLDYEALMWQAKSSKEAAEGFVSRITTRDRRGNIIQESPDQVVIPDEVFNPRADSRTILLKQDTGRPNGYEITFKNDDKLNLYIKDLSVDPPAEYVVRDYYNARGRFDAHASALWQNPSFPSPVPRGDLQFSESEFFHDHQTLDIRRHAMAL